MKRKLCSVCVAVICFFGLISLAQSEGEWMRGKELTWDPKAQVEDAEVRYNALVIGISDYAKPESGVSWDQLGKADDDAIAVSKILSEKYGFYVKTLLNEAATREGIMRGLDSFMNLGLQDAFLVYFAGHGFYDDKLGEGFWIPHDAIYTRGGRPAREGWIWNSTVSAILSGIKARHVLVIADSCYSGSLFRGGPPPPSEQGLQWYKRVNAKPSRYLISSGDYEPVPDGKGDHSVFTGNLLNYLNDPGQSIFAASDIGMTIRRSVSQETGQMVRMGPLNMPTHAGGEFVFIQTPVEAAPSE